MSTPKNIKGGAVIGALHGTGTVTISTTPVDVWGWSVFNGQSTVQNAAIGATTNAMFTSPYAAGHSQVSSFGYKLDSLVFQVTHTNMSALVFYTPYQQ